jgi:GT2 family glycosyltransferase
MTKTIPDPDNQPGSIGALLSQHRQQNPASSLLILRDGLSPGDSFEAAIRDLMERILTDSEGPVVLTALSNAVTELNPFAGLGGDLKTTPETSLLEGLVSLLGPGRVLEWHDWPDHVAFFSPAAIEALSEPGTTAQNALARLHQAGGKLLLADSIFLHDPARDLFYQKRLEPHEQSRPTAWGLLSQRLDVWLRLDPSLRDLPGISALEDFHSAEKPVTLHVTHSWGGGIAQWVESFIDADGRGINFQLRSESPQTGRGYGQRYSLYLANRLDAPVATWWLQPPIRSTADGHGQYRNMLREILSRYGAGRIMISSLVGHSLDALATDLPTTQVLHDFYPLWPLLGVHPGPFLEKGKPANLKAALESHEPLPEFRKRDATGWETLGRHWRESVITWGVRMAAPSRSTADLLRQLDPAWSDIDIDIIPHGLPELAGTAEVLPRDREDGRLRLVIPGRIQPGKGQRLLLEALPELTRYAHVCLLGAGKYGEVFFGKSGVNVITQYQREDLRELLVRIAPHAACLLSIVPETFSYTLSEMQQLNIPVIATRVGSLRERISHGETGWLIEPDEASFIARVRSLFDDRVQLRGVRERLMDFDLPGTGQMVEKYEKTCRPRPAKRSVTTAQDIDDAQTAATAYRNVELAAHKRALEKRIEALDEEVEKRGVWAEERENARKDEVDRRKRWVAALEQQLETAQEALDHEQAVHRQTNLRLENLRAEHDWVLASLSWRITRPFRVARRMLANLIRARAWNPLRWPLLMSQWIRTLKTRGVRGSLVRAQLTGNQEYLPERIDSESFEAVGDPDPPACFPTTAEPQVSVIIPVFNKWVYTAACLRSLAESQGNSSFEVIVVDDQSSDETPERLAEIDGLAIIRNEQNLGFVGSCNRGAEEARGRYLVLLNNDTQVLSGWLDALIGTFQRYPDTGLAGARLIYPDGKMQEAGGIIFRDGSGWNYGKDDDADRPEYQYSREVDYCSGACIMMETRLFRELGGLDQRYAPAYYEDTDLAFQVRAKGLKVRLEPAATIVHHEGITSGTDMDSGAKRYQAVNREKFLARWREELASFPAPITDPGDGRQIRKARDHRLKGRVLIIDAYTPEPDQDSGSLRLCYLMDCYSELGYGVTFLADNRAHAGDYTKNLQRAGVEVVYNPWAGSLQRFFGERGAEFDFVMISRHYVAANYIPLLNRYCNRAKFIFDTVDLHYLREERLAELENSLSLKRSAAQTRRSELAVINAADATLVVSPVEKTVLEEAAPETRVHVISNVHEVVGSQRPFSERKDIFFVGGYQHPPNIDAALWFVGSIWPLIRKKLPDIRFHLIGSKAPEQIRALHGNGVHFQGFVKSMDPWLDGCRLAVAPLRYGAGIKGKVNLSMSRGQPVVATPMAVEGMLAQAGRDVLVADSAEDFAGHVVRLYQDEDLWNRVSAAGLENVRRYFSVETARLGLENLLKSFE